MADCCNLTPRKTLDLPYALEELAELHCRGESRSGVEFLDMAGEGILQGPPQSVPLGNSAHAEEIDI